MESRSYDDFINYLRDNKLEDLFFSNVNYKYEIDQYDYNANSYIPLTVNDNATFLKIRYKDDTFFTVEINEKIMNKYKSFDITPESLKELVSKYDGLLDSLLDSALKIVIEDKKNRDDLAKAGNPNSSAETLLELLEYDRGKKILEYISANPNCPKEALEKVFDMDNKKESFTRSMYNVITHPNCPMDKVGDYYFAYIKKIKHDKDSFFENGIKTSNIIGLTEHMLDIVNNPDCPISTLKQFSNLSGFLKQSSIDFSKDKSSDVNYLKQLEKKIVRAARSKINKHRLSSGFKFRKSDGLHTISNVEKHGVTTNEKFKNFDNELDKVKNKNIKHKVSERELLIDYGDHREFNPKYIDSLKSIDLSEIDSTNLKVSGIDFRGTNIIIDPQLVYMKDLSNSSFSDMNIVSNAYYTGVNLCGSNMLEVKYLTGISSAFVDENTLLPYTYAIIAGTYKER